jgi:2-aminoadipate transaminase
MMQPATLEALSLARWTQTMTHSAIQDALAAIAQPDVLSFALGLPAPELFPAELFAQAATQVLTTQPYALQYQPELQPLKAQIVALMAQRGVTCREQQVFLTTGSQQALSLVARMLLDPGGQVLAEETIYSGFLQAIEPFQPTILTVPTDLETGMDVDAVEALLSGGARPAFIYAISDGHNPLAVSMSAEKRARLVELAQQYGVPIVEDDAYGFLWYESRSLPPMRALDEQWVFYAGSFSKILAPSLRAGWLIVPEELIPTLAAIKEASDINTSTFTQRIIAAYIAAGHLPEHIATLRQVYHTRRDAMLNALQTHFPSEAHWRTPASGLFIWVELPAAVDAGELLRRAITVDKVAFIPGHAFGVGGSRRSAHCMRLNFSNCGPERIEEGITRLARALSR